MIAEVFHSVDDAREKFGPCAVAIGNFDGFHLGHQSLIRRTREIASERGLIPSVLTFDPHPTAIVAPDRTPQMICTLAQRIQLLANAGIQRILVLPFTRELSRLTPAEFASRILRGALDAKAVLVGENFRFGHQQSGDRATLAHLGAELGFEAVFLKAVIMRGEVVSSSVIRRSLVQNNVVRAWRFLGRPFALSGAVQSGDGIGSKQTVPTLNLAPTPGLVLPRGVFIGETASGNQCWRSITNIGTRPTFEGQTTTIETFLLALLNGPPPAEIEVRLRHFVRAEKKFSSPEELKSQILRDVARASAYWRRFDIINRSTPQKNPQ